MALSRNPGRVAGLWYLALTLAAPLRLMYIPGKLFVAGDAAATLANIAAHETLFRLGILADLLSGTILIFLTLALYRLFKNVDRNLAALVVIVGGVLPAAIDFVNVVNDGAVLILSRGADFQAAFTTPQREGLAMLFLRLHGQQIVAAEIFWGLWLFPLAVLTYRSRFLPRFIGVWLIVNGIAYLVLSLTGLFRPQIEDRVALFAFPAQLGEVAFMLWLVVRGAIPRPAAISAV